MPGVALTPGVNMHPSRGAHILRIVEMVWYGRTVLHVELHLQIRSLVDLKDILRSNKTSDFVSMIYHDSGHCLVISRVIQSLLACDKVHGAPYALAGSDKSLFGCSIQVQVSFVLLRDVSQLNLARIAANASLPLAAIGKYLSPTDKLSVSVSISLHSTSDGLMRIRARPASACHSAMDRIEGTTRPCNKKIHFISS